MATNDRCSSSPPILARVFARAGWSKSMVRAALFEHARIPAWRFEKLIGEWSNLTPGRRTLVELVAEGGAASGVSPSPTTPTVPSRSVTAPDKIMIAVAGDPNRTNAYVMSHDGPHGDWTAKVIDRSRSEDLACIVPPPPIRRLSGPGPTANGNDPHANRPHRLSASPRTMVRPWPIW